MVFSRLNERIVAALDILDALYFFLQSTQVNEERLNKIRQTFQPGPPQIRLRLLDELRSEVKWLRAESGAIAPSSDFLRLFTDVRQLGDKGHVLIPKWEVDRRWFRNFDRVIVRWPYVKDHAMVIYDPKDPQVRNQLFELEGSLFDDAQVLLQQARVFHKGVEDFRRRERADQFLLHTYLRTGTTVIFHFLEAYLNGLAFDCLLHYHDHLSPDDHDLLIEWDRNKMMRRYVAFEKKVFRYPVVFGKCRNIKVDLSGCNAAHFLAKDAKEIRDALTHPSPHIDRENQTLKKLGLLVAMSLPAVESIFDAAKDYVLTVEKALFGRPEETAPWLFPKPADDARTSPLRPTAQK
jgi:hypothetical protein